MKPTAKVKNWAMFQHYKDRSPPWLKLHRGLLDDFAYQRLPIASRALAPMLWLLASESADGSIDLDPEFLAFRLRCPVSEIVEGIGPLIDKGFLIPDSDALAMCLQSACLEGEGEGETEVEGEKKPTPPATKAKKPKPAAEPTFAAWFAAVEHAVPSDDPLFAWAAKTGIPAEWIGYAWAAFADRYAAKPEKTYADWRAAFRDHVKRGWLDIWRADRSGAFLLTTVGEQWKKAA